MYLRMPSPQPFLLPELNFIPSFLYFLSPRNTEEQGMEIVVRSLHMVCATPSCLGGEVLTLQHGVPTIGNSPAQISPK